MINMPLVIRNYLTSQSAITTLTGTRVYAERNEPPKTYRITDGDCLTFKIRGGSQDYTGCLLQPSVQFRCYGQSELNAYDLYRTLFDTLNDVSPAGNQILLAREEVTGQSLIDLETEWHFVLTFYEMKIRNIT